MAKSKVTKPVDSEIVESKSDVSTSDKILRSEDFTLGVPGYWILVESGSKEKGNYLSSELLVPNRELITLSQIDKVIGIVFADDITEGDTLDNIKRTLLARAIHTALRNAEAQRMKRAADPKTAVSQGVKSADEELLAKLQAVIAAHNATK